MFDIGPVCKTASRVLLRLMGRSGIWSYYNIIIFGQKARCDAKGKSKGIAKITRIYSEGDMNVSNSMAIPVDVLL